jgi:protein ImuB
VTTVALSAVPALVRASQLGLFAPPGPAPERLATTLAQLTALCGPDRVGAPAPVDTHRPGAAAVVVFSPDPAPSRGGPVSPDPALSRGGPPVSASCRLVVRVLRPPRPVDVFTERDAPTFVRGPGFGGRVVGAAGPWRLAGEWWSPRPLARDYYDLELSDGGVYRCYRELSDGGRWLVDGVYD